MAINLAGFIDGAFIARENGADEEEAATFGVVGAMFPNPLLGAVVVQGLTDSGDRRDATEVITAIVPSSTPQTAQVYISGTLSVLGTGLPDWQPDGLPMTQLSGTHWKAELTGPPGANLEYKFTLGDSDSFEKDDSCGEISNRTLTLPSAGTRQDRTDKVVNWNGLGKCASAAIAAAAAPAAPVPAAAGRP